MSFNVNDPVAVVTGASRGLGLGVAQHLVQKGYLVVGISRNPPPANSQYIHLQADLSNTESTLSAFREIRRQFGKIDVLINNAAFLNSQYLMIMSTSSIESMISTNLTGVVVVSREAIKLMRRNQFGRIIHMSSMATVLKPPGDSVYAATKSAVETFSGIIAKEIFELGITSNVVSISAFDSDMFRSLNQENVAKIVNALPIARLVELSEVTDILDFLISPAGASVTGQVIRLGGVS
jgi:3-oxoacyl-[acyl-carrier protein] reductase